MLTAEGAPRLTPSWQRTEPLLICTAHAHGVRVVYCVDTLPEFVNGPQLALLRNSSARTRAARGLAAAADRYGFDGIQLDFEGITAGGDEGGLYVDFVHELQRSLTAPEHRVAVTVPAHTAAAQAFPLGALATAADAVVVLAYDMASPTHPGYNALHPANSPLPGVRELLAALPAQGLLPNRTILAAPWFGMQYRCRNGSSWEAGGCDRLPAGEQVSYWELKAFRANMRGCSWRWDDATSTPFYRCQTARRRDGGWHCGAPSAAAVGAAPAGCEGWFDDAKSLGMKYSLARQMGL